MPARTDLQLVEVRFTENDRIEVQNPTTETVDARDYWFCANNDYRRLGSLPVEGGRLSIPPGETVVLSGLEIDFDSDLALFRVDDFESSAAIVDYVRWGQIVVGGRESVAVQAGIWTAGDSVDVFEILPGQSIEYDGDGDASSDWSIQPEPTLNEPPVVPSVSTADYTVDLRPTVFVDEVVIRPLGWLVIREDDGTGGIGMPIGFRWLVSTVTENIDVELVRRTIDGETLYAVLHTDAGQSARFEFPGPDSPVERAGRVVSDTFVVTVPPGTPDIQLFYEGGAPDYAVSLLPRTFIADLEGEAPLQPDPQVTLRVGWRYEVVNRIARSDPWEIVDAMGVVLLSQAVDGTLEGDPAIDWQDDGAGRSRFTVTGRLVDAAVQYRSSERPTMMIGDLIFR